MKKTKANPQFKRKQSYCAFLQTTSYLGAWRSTLCVLSISSQRMLKIFKDQDLVILIIYCFLMDIFKWNLHFLEIQVCSDKEYCGNKYNLVPMPCLIHQHPTSAFHCQCKSQHTEKGKQHVSFMETVWPHRPHFENCCSTRYFFFKVYFL